MSSSNNKQINSIKAPPKHIAIIMDGNGRWAKSKGLPRSSGHQKGVESVRTIVKHCAKIGVSTLTLFAFSSENMNRPKKEVELLFKLFLTVLKNETKKLKNNKKKVIRNQTRKIDTVLKPIIAALDFQGACPNVLKNISHRNFIW